MAVNNGWFTIFKLPMIDINKLSFSLGLWNISHKKCQHAWLYVHSCMVGSEVLELGYTCLHITMHGRSLSLSLSLSLSYALVLCIFYMHRWCRLNTRISMQLNFERGFGTSGTICFKICVYTTNVYFMHGDKLMLSYVLRCWTLMGHWTQFYALLYTWRTQHFVHLFHLPLHKVVGMQTINQASAWLWHGC